MTTKCSSKTCKRKAKWFLFFAAKEPAADGRIRISSRTDFLPVCDRCATPITNDVTPKLPKGMTVMRISYKQGLQMLKPQRQLD